MTAPPRKSITPEVSVQPAPQVAASGTALRTLVREPARSSQDAGPAGRLHFSCPGPEQGGELIQLAHGSGGRLGAQLLAQLLLPAFADPLLARLEDQATVDFGGGRLAFTTDSFVVDPLFFPGGDIGELAINGTVNDLAMGGAKPLYLSVALIIEEGLPIATLQRVAASLAGAARRAGVRVVTGDTKVVGKGGCDKLFINTSGIGLVPSGINLSAANLRPGDKIIISGTMADHGMAILSCRQGLSFAVPLMSDTAPLSELVAAILARLGDGVAALRAMRDPTRGGVAATLNELAQASGVGVVIEETELPVAAAVRGACEILGIDPLMVANEGKMVAVVAPEAAEAVLAAMREHPLGSRAAIIGEVVADHPGLVALRTVFGPQRIVQLPLGEQLPRIC